jgi:phage-related minor tail protein
MSKEPECDGFMATIIDMYENMGDELDRIKSEHNARQTQCENTGKSLVDEMSNQQAVASSAATELADAMGSETKAVETCRVI